jgi:hypothetical protein
MNKKKEKKVGKDRESVMHGGNFWKQELDIKIKERRWRTNVYKVMDTRVSRTF